MTQIANITPNASTGAGSVPTNSATLANIFETSDKVYSVMEIDIFYDTDYHTVQLATASDTVKTASFGILANPTMRKTVRFSVETEGDQPTLPTPYSGDSNEILLSHSIVPSNVTTDATTSITTWRLSGEYVYGIVDPTKVKLYAAAPPNLTLTIQQTEIQSTNFKTGITSPYSPSTGFSVSIKA